MHVQYAAGMAGPRRCLTAPLALGIRALTSVGWSAPLAPTAARSGGRGASRERRRKVPPRRGTRSRPRPVLRVVAMALLPVLLVVGGGAAGLRNAGTEAVIAAYVAIALAGAVAFRRASRVAVGVDGVFVTGQLGARAALCTRTSTGRAPTGAIWCSSGRRGWSLRLQLHGKGCGLAGRALLARLQDAIRAAHASRGGDGGRSSPACRRASWRAPRPARRTTGLLPSRATSSGGGRGDGARRDDPHGRGEGARADAGRARPRNAFVSQLARCAEPELRVELLDLAEESDDPDRGRATRAHGPLTPRGRCEARARSRIARCTRSRGWTPGVAITSKPERWTTNHSPRHEMSELMSIDPGRSPTA